jgi:hypothetical protein
MKKLLLATGLVACSLLAAEPAAEKVIDTEAVTTQVDIAAQNSCSTGYLGNHKGTIKCMSGIEDLAPGWTSLTSVEGDLNLAANGLKNVDNLSSLKKVSGQIILSSNKLSNIKGLSSLESVSTINLSANKDLADLSPIANIKDINSVILSATAVTDLSPLNKLNLKAIKADVKDYSVKMSADSHICQNFGSIVKNKIGKKVSMRDKSKFCEK